MFVMELVYLKCSTSGLLILSVVINLSSQLTGPEKSDLCYRENRSCSHQLSIANVTDGDCQMIYYKKESEDCSNLSFHGDKGNNLGIVRLKSYFYKFQTHTIPAFNVSFTHVKWKFLRMRFKEVGGELKNFCREFKLARKVPVTTELFFDCLWSMLEYQEHSFGFEYEIHGWDGETNHRQYVLRVPGVDRISPLTSIRDWELFMYVDITDIPDLVLRWQLAPSRFAGHEFKVTKYEVCVYRKVGSVEELLESKNVSSSAAENSELTYRYATNGVRGTYFFRVQMLHDDCGLHGCYIAKSHYISTGTDIQWFLIGIVGCSVLIPVVLCTFHVWRKSCVQSRARENERIRPAPIVLIIYVPTHPSHVNVVVALTEYLRDFCGIDALLDKLHIPVSRTKDPFIWCNEAFARSDFVMVVSSPNRHGNNWEGIYKNVDAVGLQLLKEKFGARSPKPNFFAVQMPYCTERDIPTEAKNLKRFCLPKDLDIMLRYIHQRGRSMNFRLPRRPVRRGKSDIHGNGRPLLDAIKQAQEDVSKTSTSESTAGKANGEMISDISRSFTNEKLISECDEESIEFNHQRSPETTVTDSLEPLMENESSQSQNNWDPETYPINVKDINLMGADGEDRNTRRNPESKTKATFNIQTLKL